MFINGLVQIRCFATKAVKSAGSVETRILNKLKEKYGYNLFHAEIKNTSWQHDKPKDAETHLQLILVTSEFEGQKHSSREEATKTFLSEEIKNLEEFKTTCLSPSKWYDSNQRGLKLKEVYCDPPIAGGQLKQMVNSFHTAKTSAKRS